MKIRNGFVSNSSSSSFCVVFPKRPKNREELMKFIFPGKEPDDHKTYYDAVVHINEVIDFIYQQLEQQKNTASAEEISTQMKSRYYYGWLSFNYGRGFASGPKWYLTGEEKLYYSDNKLLSQLIELEKLNDSIEYFDHNNEESKQKYLKDYLKLSRKKEKLINKMSIQEATKLIEDNKKKFIALFEFADETSLGCVCEHVYIFNESGLFFIRSSNH